MSISVSELRKNLGKYLRFSATEEIFITKNGKIVAKLSNPFKDRVSLVESLVGVLHQDTTIEEAREERLSKI